MSTAKHITNKRLFHDKCDVFNQSTARKLHFRKNTAAYNVK